MHYRHLSVISWFLAVSLIAFHPTAEASETEEILAGQVDRVRYGGHGQVPLAVRQAAEEQFVYVADRPISHLGRLELLWYVREQSISIDYHRYGNLGFRATEQRSPVL